MQPSTWNDTNQHWLSQFLLKGFGIRRRAGEVYELDKETNAIGIRKVAAAASKRHLLTERDDALMRGIENRVNPVINAIRKGRLSIGEDGRQAIDDLVYAMMRNDPYGNTDSQAARQETIDEVTRKLSDAVAKYGMRLDEQDAQDSINGQLSHDYLSASMNSASSMLRVALRLMGLHLYQAANRELFIIGDSPVMIARGTLDGAPSLLNPGSQIILPISSTCLLVYAWEIETNVIGDGGTLDREQVRSLNEDYYHGTSSRRIYGRNREVLERSRMLSLKWISRERSTVVKDGWFQMQIERTKDRELHQMEESTRAMRFDQAAQELVLMTIVEAMGAAGTDNAKRGRTPPATRKPANAPISSAPPSTAVSSESEQDSTRTTGN